MGGSHKSKLTSLAVAQNFVHFLEPNLSKYRRFENKACEKRESKKISLDDPANHYKRSPVTLMNVGDMKTRLSNVYCPNKCVRACKLVSLRW
jgi:hypothetical protein